MAILHYMGAGLGTSKQSEAIEASIIKFYNIQLRLYFINVDLRAELQYYYSDDHYDQPLPAITTTRCAAERTLQHTAARQ